MAATSDKIRVIVVDDTAETRETIRKLLQFENDIDVVGMGRNGREGVQLAREMRPNVVLMDINMPDMDGIAATRAIVKDVPTAQIVIVSVQQDTDYLRQAMLAGARDFLSKPPSADELINTIRRLGLASKEQELATVRVPVTPGAVNGSAPTALGKILVCYSPKGGSGKTTLAVNLAVALQGEDRKVCVVDANTQFGDIGVFFNLKGKTSLVTAVQQVDEVDETAVTSWVAAHSSGVKVLLGSQSPEDSELITAAPLKRLLLELRHHFTYVVVDVASILRDLELGMMDAADRVLVVAAPDIPTLANVKKYFDLCEKLEYSKDKPVLVVNKMDKRWGITPQSIEDSLKHPVYCQIPYEDRVATQAINAGVPFVMGDRKAAPSAAVIELATKLRADFAPKDPTGKPAEKRKSIFSR